MTNMLATTKMSSRGQVVIPESIRDELGLKPGAQFVVLGQDDMVMFKVISPPSREDYACLKRQLRRQARETGLRRSDIPKAIDKVRARR